ncbi:glutathione S-transferase family protein [Methyloligella sp. 2.7D]|uniref:glutathione S-transferase family protein n=1 Tax=unclassified Methyloligella TaxID=2625955 RepID=UPI00157D3201|nr:glutathione S-transferase family protein [Methyloligella sp. GL2]QKP77286.1 glutathione S-transferase family protein [Methyloligella sp. GL2]
MAQAVLTISSKNYSSWSLRGWLLCKMAGLEFEEESLPSDDPSTRAELLLLSPSFLVPCLTHERVRVWDTLAIAEYLAERFPGAGLLPQETPARAHCRAISGEMHSGFQNLRSALPMNIKARLPSFAAWTGVKSDVERVLTIWQECQQTYGGPFLFGEQPTLADAMYAPVCTRFYTYDVKLDPVSASYCATIMNWPLMEEWVDAAKEEPDELEELDVEF